MTTTTPCVHTEPLDFDNPRGPRTDPCGLPAMHFLTNTQHFCPRHAVVILAATCWAIARNNVPDNVALAGMLEHELDIAAIARRHRIATHGS